MFEEYPFWHFLFTACNIQVRLSDVSVYADYERCASKVMSDNICFPAKLVHSHIDNLLQRKVDRIFMPLVMYEKFDKQSQNSYNCPIVSGYSQVVKSVRSDDTPIDSPVISFKDEAALYKQCLRYLQSLGVKDGMIRKAFDEALKAQEKFERDMTEYNDTLLREANDKGALTILLAGRPYHTDALIQHKVSEMIAAQGAYVLTDDIVRDKPLSFKGMDYLPQWAFTNRIIKSARWAAEQGRRLQYMQLTSFGCGPDAFLTDEVRAVLKRGGKNLTLLKIDDVNNIGSLKLRVRSLVESLGISENGSENKQKGTVTLPPYTSEQKGKKIIAPFFTPFISPLIPSLVKLAGYDAECLPMSDSESGDWGLRNSNNEVCYPATLIVGDIVKAFKSKRYDPDNTCVAITQTGGQCRASNYISLIRKALVENGYVNTPVISLAVGSGIDNDQPAFKVNWFKILPVALASIIYSDCIAKLYYASVVRETEAGAAGKLRDKYLSAACGEIRSDNVKGIYSLLSSAVKEFDGICLREERPKVGVIGEIFLKFHPFAQKHVADWLLERKIEVVYPALVDFFIQTFVNQKVNRKENLKKPAVPERILDLAYRLVRRELDKANDICKGFRYFIPFEDIFDKAKLAAEAISLNIQFGEGWLLAGEAASLSRIGVNHIVSLQPFGCIANHIAEKGIENRLKALYPDLNILSLDFDGSVSEVNIINRMLLFINDLHR